MQRGRKLVVDRRTFLCWAAGGGMGALALACAGPGQAPTGAAPSGAAGPGPAATAGARPAELTRWRHAEPSAIFESAFRHMGVRKGFAREAGLDVEIQHLLSGTTIIKGLVAGEYDSADIGSPPVYPSIEGGAEIRILASLSSGLFYAFYVRREIQSVRDLVGKPIGTNDPGALLYQLAQAALEAQGLDPTQVEYANVGGSPAIFQAVLAGKVAGGVSGVEWLREAERSGEVKPLFYVGEVLPNFLRQVFIASERVMRERPDELTRWLAAYARGHRYALDHRDETVRLASELTGVTDLDNLGWTFDWYVQHGVVDPNFRVPPEKVDYMQELSIRLGSQRTKLPYERIVNPTFRERVLASLGEYRPGASG